MSEAFALPERWRAVRLVLIRPAGWVHASAVAEVIESLAHALRALGVAVDTADNQIAIGAVNILFMAFALQESDLAAVPDSAIIYNFEQVGGDVQFMTPAFKRLITTHRVWDYSPRNAERLAPLTGHDRLQVVPVGYVPALTRIPKAPVQDIDVLFYGAVNPRRRDILVGLQEAGLNIVAPFGVYGAERDALIARAKVVLNMHAHASKVMEVVRVSYLLANRKAVVAELDPDTEVEPDIRAAVAGVPYDGLIAECQRLVADAAARQELEDRGYALFQQRDLVPILRRVIREAADV